MLPHCRIYRISSEGCNSLPVYIHILLPVIFLLEIVFLFLHVSGFLFEDGGFSALTDSILKKYAFGVFCKTFYTYLKKKICKGLLCHRLYNENFEFS